MRLLDLFCGSGGAARGYELAGFDFIIGVDSEPILNYPYHFIQADAIEYLEECDITSFDLIHASPPCQQHSLATRSQNRDNHDCYIKELREFFDQNNCYYVIENVRDAPLIDPIILEGNMFNLPIVRRRLFEVNWQCSQPELRKYKDYISRYVTLAGNGGTASSYKLYNYQLATGIWWMNRAQIIQAIPPKYTQYIGEKFLQFKENVNGSARGLG